MKIVAFLQNQWFNNPERVKQAIAHTIEREAARGGKDAHGVREYYIAAFLFMGCLTGRQLKRAFGERLCHEIVWEQASREIGGHSGSVFPADLAHIEDVIRRHKPDVVLAFGKIAVRAIHDSSIAVPVVITGPHPASRTKDVRDRLEWMAKHLRALRS